VNVSVWEAIFMLGVLKIPMIYLGVVVWWALRAEPRVEDGGDETPVLSPLTPCGWDDWKRRRPVRVGRRPTRPVRPRRVARARA
jgi:hypothetical protein